MNSIGALPLKDRYDQRTDMPVDQDRFIAKGMSATYTQGLTDTLDFKLVGTYRDGDGRQFIDFEELNANLFQVPAEYSDRQASDEAQLTYTSERVKGVAGAYYFDGMARGAFDLSLGASNFTSLTKGQVDTQSIAVYLDTTWTLSDRLNLNVGARWNEDKKDATVFVAQYLGRLEANQTMFDQNNLPPGFLLLAVQSDYPGHRKFSDVSPRLGFDYRVNDDLLAYVSYSQGFKSGGFGMRGNAAANPDTKNGYDSESADNYEIGMKSNWLEDRLQLNLTAFYTPYHDVQLPSQQLQNLNGILTNVTAVLNAGKALNKGAELETIWQPLPALTMVLNVGYLDAKFAEFLVGCTPPAAQCQTNVASLNSPINAPDWTSFLGATHRWELGVGDLAAHLGYQYRSKTKVANTTVSITDQDAYDLLDLGVSYTTSDGAWRFALEGKNVLDQEYRVAGYDFGNTNISQIGFYGAPRTFSISATYRY